MQSFAKIPTEWPFSLANPVIKLGPYILLISKKLSLSRISFSSFRIEYAFLLFVGIIDDKPKRFYAVVDQSGLSFNNWKFRIQCRDFNYTEIEKQYAKRPQLKIGNQIVKNTEGMPDWFVPLVNRITKDKELKKKLNKESGF